jgi:hypothetical protein
MTEEEKINLEFEYDKILSDLSENRLNELYIFIRQILIISSTILGILITLKDKKICEEVELYSFITVIVLFGLCILIGVTLLYGKVDILNTLDRKIEEHKNKLLAGEQKYVTSIVVKSSDFFLILEKIYFIVFGLSICSLIVYSVFAFSY